MITSLRRRISAATARFPFITRFLRNASWLYTSSLFSQFISFLLTIYVATKFVPADYGRVGVVMAYCITLNKIIDFRIWEAVINFYGAHVERSEMRKAWATLKICLGIDFSTGVIGLLITWATAEWAAVTFLQDPTLAVFVRLYGLTLFTITVGGSTNAILRVHDKFSWLGITGVLSALAKGVITVLFLSWNVSLASIFLAYLAIEIVVALLLYIPAAYISYNQVIRQARDEPKEGNTINRGEVWSIIKFSIGTNLFGTLRHIAENSTLLIMGLLANDTIIGLFRLASNLINAAIQLRTPLQAVVYPDIVKAVAVNDKVKLYRLLRSATVLGAIIPGGVCIGMILFMDPVLRLTPIQREYLDAIPMMRVMLIGSIAPFVYFWLRPLLMAYNRVFFLNAGLVVRIVVWAVAALILIPVWGDMGWAYLYALSQLIWAGYKLIYIRRQNLL